MTPASRTAALLALLFTACAGNPAAPAGVADGGLADASTPDARAPDASPDARRAPDAGIGTVAAPDPCPPAPCGPATVVTTSAELAAVLNDAPSWPAWSTTSSGCIPPTREIEVRGTVTLDLADVTLPPNCLPCRTYARFKPGDLAECAELADAGGDCRRIQLTDETVRFLTYVEYAIVVPLPTVELLPPCAGTTCDAGERRCEANGVCWADDLHVTPVGPLRDHCRFCLGLAWQRCACWDGDGPRPDGEDCPFWVSNDVLSWGKCAGGLCYPP